MAEPARAFATFDLFEHRFCALIHRAGRWATVRHLFTEVSRLGDGVIWYAFLLSMPLFAGRYGLMAGLAMALGGLVGVGVYKALKTMLARERPCISHPDIRSLATPLDRYSFPSGHTLHAVFFAIMGSAWFPALAPILVAFAILVAISRPLLGLHYFTDVLVGGLIGWSLAELFLALMPPALYA